MPNKPNRLYYILVILLVLAVSFLLGEILVRVTRIGSPNPHIFLDNVLVKGRPFAKYMNRKENLNLVELNNWGFHDRNRDINNDNYRILFLGDSLVEGLQVPVDSLFTTLLEEKFRNQGRQIEIINGGASGYGTVSEYLLWKRFFYRKIRADHIVVCFFVENDLEDNNSLSFYAHNKYMIYLDSMGNVCIKHPEYSPLQSVAKGLTRYSALVNTVYDRFYLLKRSYLNRKREAVLADQQKKRTGKTETTKFPSSAWNDSINGTLRLIERWNKETSGEGIRFSMVVINSPYFYVRGGHENRFKEELVTELKRLCRRDKIQILELNFTDYDPFDIYSFDGVLLGHFNYTGHRLAAEQIFSWLKEFI